MARLKLIKTKLQDAVWHGILTGASTSPPAIGVTHRGSPVPDVKLDPGDQAGQWLVRVPIPVSAISDGVQTLLIRDTATDVVIGDITLLAGELLSQDIRVELAQMRAELELLQRAFRRHCQETK